MGSEEGRVLAEDAQQWLADRQRGEHQQMNHSPKQRLHTRSVTHTPRFCRQTATRTLLVACLRVNHLELDQLDDEKESRYSSRKCIVLRSAKLALRYV